MNLPCSTGIDLRYNSMTKNFNFEMGTFELDGVRLDSKRGIAMMVQSKKIEELVIQSKQLTPESRLRLIQRITDTLIPEQAKRSKPLQYGKYQEGKMSTLEDFALAEWRPSEKDLHVE